MNIDSNIQVKYESSPIEWPTWLLIVFVYNSWLLLLQFYHDLGAILAIPLLTFICALHGSMCHEIIHGHPTRMAWFNALLGRIPLTLFLPYPIYCESHLQHHHDEDITIPGRDPESYYCSANEYQNKSKPGKVFAWVNMTVAGRLLLNPAVEIFRLTKMVSTAVITFDIRAIWVWLVHLALVGVILLLVTQYFQVPWWQYLLVAYFANSLTRIRSFYEHRARTTVSERTVIMESGWFFRLLFLNLNYHLAHHDHPAIPWYRSADYYQAHRLELINRSGDFYYRGYRFWLLGHLFRPVDSPVHPFV